MTVARGLLVAMLLGVSNGAFAASQEPVVLAWQMETVEPGQGQGIAGDDNGASGYGRGGGVGSSSGAGSAVEPVRPGGRGSLFGNDASRPTIGEGREPFYRPGSGRNCSGEGPGRVCF
ncbi:MAG: hypothetical protein JNM75_03240 [Rhodospirillales bacterium]|nr:hypothetical protein [Rhodospirillales bacterium]